MLRKFKGKEPVVPKSCFVASDAVLVGDVELEENVNVWFGVTIRGDINFIRIGKDSNIQEQTVIHVDQPDSTGGGATIVGERVTVGHRALLHACKIGDDCLIGMGAIILSGAEIVGAGALVLENQVFPPGSLLVGLPAKVKGSVDAQRLASIKASAEHYVELAQEYLRQDREN